MPTPFCFFGRPAQPGSAVPRIGRPQRDRAKVKSGRKAARRNRCR